MFLAHSSSFSDFLVSDFPNFFILCLCLDKPFIATHESKYDLTLADLFFHAVYDQIYHWKLCLLEGFPLVAAGHHWIGVQFSRSPYSACNHILSHPYTKFGLSPWPAGGHKGPPSTHKTTVVDDMGFWAPCFCSLYPLALLIPDPGYSTSILQLMPFVPDQPYDLVGLIKPSWWVALAARSLAVL